MKAGEFDQMPHGREIANLGGAFQGKMLTKTMMEEQLEMIIRTHEVAEFGGALHGKMQIKITMDMSLGGACQEKMQTETAVILHREMTDRGQEMTVKMMAMTTLLNKEEDQVLHISHCQLLACQWQRSLRE